MGDLRRRMSVFWLLLPVAIVAIVVFTWPEPASAQCGSSASSCKNCHEVQGEYPVNNSGEWHVSHAFGDFCEFCHAGNVQATDMEAAHTGMVYPLEDVNASCLNCHPDDVAQKAEVYAVALGVTVGAGDGGDGAVGGGDAGAVDAAPDDPQAETPATEADTAAEEGQGEIVDFNSQYARTVLDERPPVNVGNAILTALSIGFFALGGVLVWKWEGLGQRWQALRGQPGAQAQSTATARTTVRATERRAAPATADPVARPESRGTELAGVLQDADASTLQALQRILTDTQTGEAMIKALAKLDPRLVRLVARLDKEERALLMAVVEMMGWEEED